MPNLHRSSSSSDHVIIHFIQTKVVAANQNCNALNIKGEKTLKCKNMQKQVISKVNR